jgi:predicted dehydrogenase
MSEPTRRQFLGSAVQFGAGAALASVALPKRKSFAANERVRFALIGCGGRGRVDAFNMIDQGGECVGLCDVKDSARKDVNQFLDGQHDTGPIKEHKYPEEVFARDDIDAVIIATPDHWHGPLTVQACQAGKDVYVEKPHSHNIWESYQMIDAARKHERIVQVGTQNRSAAYNHKARDYIQAGNLGPTHLIQVYNLKSDRGFVDGTMDEPKSPPKDLDWDRWPGPAPEWSYHDRLFNGYWHGYWDFSGGDLVNDASHQTDLALMVLGEPGMPRSVSTTAGRFAHDGPAEVPDLQLIQFAFADFLLTVEQSNYPKYMRKSSSTIRRKDKHPHWLQNSTRIELYGQEQMMVLGRHGGGWEATTYPWRVEKQMYGQFPDKPHARNFLESVQSRTKPNADIELLHPSVCMLHMANIAHRIRNKTLRWDEQSRQFDDKQANALIKRDYREGYGLSVVE